MQGSCDTDWDVDKYRSDHEPRHHWELRRRFLVQNKGRFPEDRLVCLAQTFANIEFMGCRYPKDTMDLVELLAFGIVQDYRDQQKHRLQRTFVSGSSAAGAKVNRSTPSELNPGSKRKSSDDYASASSSAGVGPPNRKYGRFVESTSESSSLSVTVFNSKPEEDQPEASDFDPKTTAYPPQPRVVGGDPRLSFASRFLIMRLEYSKDEHPCNILSRSAGFCKMPITWDLKSTRDNTWICKVKLQESMINCTKSAGDETKNDVRDRAANEALEMLSKQCYTILIKNKFLGDGSTVDLEDLEEAKKSSESVPSSNIGHKLLKMMGWSGGGLGKGGGGISEPITANAICNRAGLGSKSAMSQFKQRVKKIVEEYAVSSNPYDLVFTTGFTNEQRKEMHMIAKRLGLKSKSFGKDEERFITISRKFDARQLVDELFRSGGSTEKYTLFEPGQYQVQAEN